MSFDWRQWWGRSSSNPKTGLGKPPVHDSKVGASPQSASPISPAAGGLLIALIFAGHYALTGHFWVAALMAAGLAAAMAGVAHFNAYRTTLRALETWRALHNLVADNASDLITRHDREGAITFASPAACALLGVSPTLLMRRGLSAAMSAGNAARCQEAVKQSLELGAPITVEVEIADGAAARWVEFRCKPLPGGDGVVAVTRDITARRWHAIAMRQAREEAESASRAKSAFIATISHELRTPLNAILGFSEMLHRDLRNHAGDARHTEYSRIIRESGEHLMSLVKDLLDISKIEAGRLTICSEPFRVPEVIASSVDTLRPTVDAKAIALEVAVADDVGEIVADRRACKQMLMNLLSNACKFTPEGGRIELTAALEDEHVLLTVRDNGIGIAPEHVARLGEPFFQVDSSHARQLEGAGLGLAIVRGLADLHGGRLEIESAPGEGSCFRLVLPLDAEAHGAVAAAEDKVGPELPAPAREASAAHRIALVA
ncbi:MAG: ATP-binding protein [Hyphomicrobiaceae bacterium]